MYSNEWNQKTIKTIRFFDEAFKELEDIVTRIDMRKGGGEVLVTTVKKLLVEREKLDDSE